MSVCLSITACYFLDIYSILRISQHMYSGSGVAGIANLPTLMSKATIRSNLSTLTSDIAAVHAKGLSYVLG